MSLYDIVLKFVENRNEIISDDENLIDRGIDSLKFIQLIVSLEEEYGISIDEESLLLDNFDTINKIRYYMEEKCGVVW